MLPSADQSLLRDIADLKKRMGRLEVYASRALQSDIDATGDITLSTLASRIEIIGNYIRGWQYNTLAANDSFNTGSWRGLILISNVTDNGISLIGANGPAGTLSVVYSNNLTVALTDTGATMSLYDSGSEWQIRNRYASAKIVRAMLFGN